MWRELHGKNVFLRVEIMCSEKALCKVHKWCESGIRKSYSWIVWYRL
nr:MAG TPA: hypothetical protein [Caudoviricetes sp.]